jgi:hypothetical protein
MKSHCCHLCTTSIQIQLSCLQWNATGPIPVPHKSRSSFRVYNGMPLVPFLYYINPDPASVFTMESHWSHSCITSIHIQLPCLQWNATGPIPVPHQSRFSFRVYNGTPLVPFLYHINPDPAFMFTMETPLIPFLYHINPDPASVLTMEHHWSHPCITSIQIQLPCLQWNATDSIPVSHQSRSNFRVYIKTPLVPFLYHTNQDAASVFRTKRHWSLSHTTQYKPAFSILLSSAIL